MDLGGNFFGRYLRLSIESEYPPQGFTFGYVTVGEVVVRAASAAAVDKPTLAVVREANGDVRVNFTAPLSPPPT